MKTDRTLALKIKQWHPIVILVFASLWMLLFPLWADWVTAEPLDTPISFATKNTIHKEIEVRIPETYRLHLLFGRGDVPPEEMEFIGSTVFSIPNVPAPLRWSIVNKKTGVTAAGGEVESEDSRGVSGGYVTRTVALVKAPPGRYIFNAEIIRPVPELAKYQVHIQMDFGAKNTDTWQAGFAVWWGQIIWYILAPLLIVYAIGALIYIQRARSSKL
ncbi:DUF5625 family protein [Collimonas silvisoli]|uniref:DUF5625 family protein n=1 Tax=Collimonas silvisoli TaxID=2825884 RepID=UPI001B8D0467|nr:DUF5625 family protein [Collimonas silvisoli]